MYSETLLLVIQPTPNFNAATHAFGSIIPADCIGATWSAECGVAAGEKDGHPTCPVQEYQVLSLEHSVHPGARKMQEKLNMMRQDSKFSTIRAEDFRNGALLENVMGALSEPLAYVCPIFALASGPLAPLLPHFGASWAHGKAL